MRRLYACLFCLSLIPAGLYSLPVHQKGQQAGKGQQALSSAQGAQNNNPAAQHDSGEQIFAENCSRCHQPPMSISPRITGTVLMHMRVRARLSHEQEAELLRYMAP